MVRFWVSIIIVCWAGSISAQQDTRTEDTTPPAVQFSSILTLDVDRLFSQSEFGIRILEDFNTQGEALAIENRRIADALREEELALATQRPDMAIGVFLAEAEAFDEKAQAIRRAQDAKQRELEGFVAEGRERFLEVTHPILGDLMVERGASAILDRRSVFLSLSSVDVTDAAIAQIDALIGDGTPTDDLPEAEEPAVQD